MYDGRANTPSVNAILGVPLCTAMANPRIILSTENYSTMR